VLRLPGMKDIVCGGNKVQSTIVVS
jgi:hypothetical protein